jgi:aspartyl protease family protein
MFARALVTIVVAGLAVGALFPSPGKKHPDPVEDTKALEKAREEFAKSGEPERSRGSSADVTLTRRANGHFYADVQVNGQTVEFMVDTGASGIALTRRDAEALGLFWNENELETVGRGVSGAVSGKMVRLDRVELGGKEVRDLDAAIIPGGLDVSLLGQSFLSRFGEVKITGDEMTLN